MINDLFLSGKDLAVAARQWRHPWAEFFFGSYLDSKLWAQECRGLKEGK